MRECVCVCVCVCDMQSLLDVHVHTRLEFLYYKAHTITPSLHHTLTAEDAIERLLDLSPYFLKNLVHLIFSRKEFTVDESEEEKRRDL